MKTARKTIEITIPSANAKQRILRYLNTIYKFHKLTDKEIEIVVELIIQYYKVSQTLRDPKDIATLSKLLFSTEVRKEIRDTLGIKEDVFNNYISKLRKKGVVVSDTLNPNYIPPYGKFALTLNFI